MKPTVPPLFCTHSRPYKDIHATAHDDGLHEGPGPPYHPIPPPPTTLPPSAQLHRANRTQPAPPSFIALTPSNPPAPTAAPCLEQGTAGAPPATSYPAAAPSLFGTGAPQVPHLPPHLSSTVSPSLPHPSHHPTSQWPLHLREQPHSSNLICHLKPHPPLSITNASRFTKVNPSFADDVPSCHQPLSPAVAHACTSPVPSTTASPVCCRSSGRHRHVRE